MEASVTQVIGASDGRRVAVDSYGDPNGFPVFLLHGTPGSRTGPVPRPPLLYRLGVRLISYDRPGYGDSDRHKGRSVAGAASDVLDIADQFGLDEFSVVGRSGGGPHALACAALIDSRRLRNVAVLVGLAPSDAEGLDWFEGMTDSNTNEYEMAAAGDDAVVADLTRRAEEIRRNPDSLLSALETEMSEADRRIVSDVGIRRRLLETYREALKFGPYGWIDDVLAFRFAWGFDLGEITVPVLLWHGDEDVFSPPKHSIWMASQIPGATIELQRGAAHFGAMEILPQVLARLKTDSVQPRSLGRAASGRKPAGRASGRGAGGGRPRGRGRLRGRRAAALDGAKGSE
jgi:pimeloyl-ACP methyl ester carboxylesterase